MISVISFDHGWYYHYRLHNQKLILLDEKFSELTRFLKNVEETCPHEFFRKGPRGSKLALSMNAQIQRISGHELSVMTKEALVWNQYRTAHSNVECFMLNFDNKTVAVEVPVWFYPGEMPDYEDRQTNSPLTGHIDILSVYDGKIWVLDYKPKAEKEKYATAQTYVYALMLSKRTGIPITDFMCGYFDEKDAFLFNPSNVKV